MVISILLIVSLAAIITASCRKTEIKTLPISNELAPVRMLDNGNYEVTKGYVIMHTRLVAENAALKLRIKELQK